MFLTDKNFEVEARDSAAKKCRQNCPKLVQCNMHISVMTKRRQCKLHGLLVKTFCTEDDTGVH